MTTLPFPLQVGASHSEHSVPMTPGQCKLPGLAGALGEVQKRGLQHHCFPVSSSPLLCQLACPELSWVGCPGQFRAVLPTVTAEVGAHSRQPPRCHLSTHRCNQFGGQAPGTSQEEREFAWRKVGAALLGLLVCWLRVPQLLLTVSWSAGSVRAVCFSHVPPRCRACA